jgi:STE24 endopeptidase
MSKALVKAEKKPATRGPANPWEARKDEETGKVGVAPPEILSLPESDPVETIRYSLDKLQLGAVTNVVSLVETYVYLAGGGYGAVWSYSGQNIYLFTLYTTLMGIVLGLPISYYSTFVLEERYGFNKSTLTTWVTDKVKAIFLGVVLGGPFLYGANWVFEAYPNLQEALPVLYFFIAGVTAFIAISAPYLIMPLFNTYTPLDRSEPLNDRILTMCEEYGFTNATIFRSDASRRSSHANAALYGVPYVRRVLLFDTFLDSFADEHVIDVVGHELGHYHLSHVPKNLIINQVHMAVIFALAYYGLHLTATAILPAPVPMVLQLQFFMLLLQPLDIFMNFAMHWHVRNCEYQADEFAETELGRGEGLANALVLLAYKEKASFTQPDPLYAAYHYSHPSIPERIRVLRRLIAHNKKKSK